MMTDQEILDDANQLARLFYSAAGYAVPDGYRFDLTENPRARGAWNLVRIAYEHIDRTDLDDVLVNLDIIPPKDC